MFLTLSSYDWSQLPNNSYHVWGVLCKYYTIESLLDISITTVIQSANMIRRKPGRTRTALNITASEVTILLWTLRTWLVIILSALLSVGPSAILGTIKQHRVIFQIKFKNVFCFVFFYTFTRVLVFLMSWQVWVGLHVIHDKCTVHAVIILVLTVLCPHCHLKRFVRIARPLVWWIWP